MTQEQFAGQVRTIMAGAGGYFIGHGLVSAGTWDLIAGVVMLVAPAAWSYYAKRQAK